MLLFFRSTHPISQILIFIIICILNNIFLSISFKNNWFSLIFIIIILGGILILFLYIARLASNEKFQIIKSIYSLPIIFFPFNFLFPYKIINENNIISIFSSFTNLNRIICILLLFLNLLIILEIISPIKSILRSFFYVNMKN